MILVDYHTHSKFSFDGKEELSVIAESAIKAGLSELAVTDHLDIIADAPYDWQLPYQKMRQALQRTQEQVMGMLVMRLGVELGQPQHNPQAARTFYQNCGDIDFIIGSIHNLESNKDVDMYDFDTIDCNALYGRYLEAVIQMAEEFDFDVAGHLTYPLRYMAERSQKTVLLNQYTEQFRHLFKILIEKGRGIELNSSGLRQKIGEPFPPLSVLKLYRECGGEIITIGSDAHRKEDIGKGIQEGLLLLEKAGFRHFTVFEQRKAKFYKI